MRFFAILTEGAMLLKETISQRSVLFLCIGRKAGWSLSGCWFDTPVFHKGGGYIIRIEDGTKYIMKKWYCGRECDLKKESELVRAARNLAVLHMKMNLAAQDQEYGGIYTGIPVRRNPLEEIKSHNRELKKVRSFVRNRVR